MGVICTAVLLNSCKKDDDKKEETASPIEGTWKMTAQTLTISFAGQDTTEDMFSDLDACEKDDLTRLSSDKKVTYLPGATKCDPNEPASTPGGTWSLSSDSKRLTITDGSGQVYDVVTLNATTLKLKISDSGRGMTSTVNTTFAKQ